MAISLPLPHSAADTVTVAERRTRLVVVIAAVTMVIEVVAGQALGSMALSADGLHMASHVFALGVAAFAYAYARTHAASPRFALGTGKVSALGGYTGASLLCVTAVLMAWESVERLWYPVTVQYSAAIIVTLAGLLINLLSAAILHGAHDHTDPAHRLAGCAHDHNYEAAYLHVVADAGTSLLALLALGAGRLWGAWWLDPFVGIVGALAVGWWAIGLMRAACIVLLDHQAPEPIQRAIRDALEQGGDRITDLRCWTVAPGHYATVISMHSTSPQRTHIYKSQVTHAFQSLQAAVGPLVIEVNDAPEPAACPAAGRPLDLSSAPSDAAYPHRFGIEPRGCFLKAGDADLMGARTDDPNRQCAK